MEQVPHVQPIRQKTWHWQAHSLYGDVAVRHFAQQVKYHRCDPLAAGTFHKTVASWTQTLAAYM
jgi:hypothetical protein